MLEKVDKVLINSCWLCELSVHWRGEWNPTRSRFLNPLNITLNVPLYAEKIIKSIFTLIIEANAVNLKFLATFPTISVNSSTNIIFRTTKGLAMWAVALSCWNHISPALISQQKCQWISCVDTSSPNGSSLLETIYSTIARFRPKRLFPVRLP